LTLLERWPLAETLAPGTQADSAPARLIDRIAELWASGASMTDIGAVIGKTRGQVSGLVDRARRRSGDTRFPARPGPSREETKQRRLEYDRQRYRREHPSAVRRVVEGAAKADAMLIGAGVTSADADRQAGRSVGAAAVLEARGPRTIVDPPLNLPIWALELGMCRFAINSVEIGRGLDLRFCGRPVVRGQYCEICHALTYSPSPKGAAATGGRFVLPVITNKLGPR
jgi:hypothetical protein